MALTEIFCNVKKASRQLASAGEELKNNVLNNLADAIMRNKDTLLKANAYDLELADSNSPMYDRLMLTDKRLDEIAEGIRNVASLPSPLDRVMLERRLPNGLRLRKISVPFGVIGAVYEARPNVSFDVFSLCLKSGNACVLKGGKDADWSEQGHRRAHPQRTGAERNGPFGGRTATIHPRSHNRHAARHRIHRRVHTARRTQAYRLCAPHGVSTGH